MHSVIGFDRGHLFLPQGLKVLDGSYQLLKFHILTFGTFRSDKRRWGAVQAKILFRRPKKAYSEQLSISTENTHSEKGLKLEDENTDVYRTGRRRGGDLSITRWSRPKAYAALWSI